MSSPNWFTNAAGELQVRCPALEFLGILMEVEQRFGRTRTSSKPGYQDRSIDLDLIYFGTEIIDRAPRLVVPHPRRLERLFVLAPLAHIAPGFVDPLENRTLGELHGELRADMAEDNLAPQEISLDRWP
jgi:7,8-dihydro-6-hydroxymethylpterin-pyrophosphokinase